MWLFHSKQQTSHKFHKRRAKILIIQTTPQTVTIQKLNISLRNNKSKENRQMGIPENKKRTKKYPPNSQTKAPDKKNSDH